MRHMAYLSSLLVLLLVTHILSPQVLADDNKFPVEEQLVYKLPLDEKQPDDKPPAYNPPVYQPPSYN